MIVSAHSEYEPPVVVVHDCKVANAPFRFACGIAAIAAMSVRIAARRSRPSGCFSPTTVAAERMSIGAGKTSRRIIRSCSRRKPSAASGSVCASWSHGAARTPVPQREGALDTDLPRVVSSRSASSSSSSRVPSFNWRTARSSSSGGCFRINLARSRTTSGSTLDVLTPTPGWSPWSVPGIPFRTAETRQLWCCAHSPWRRSVCRCAPPLGSCPNV